MGGEVEDIAVADLDSDGRPEVIAASDVGQLVCIGGDGGVIWRRNMVDKITWLTTARGGKNGGTAVLVGTDTGEIRVINAAGDLVGANQVAGEVTHLRTVASDEGEQVICATSTGQVAAFRPAW